jgi:hypothetical protein
MGQVRRPFQMFERSDEAEPHSRDAARAVNAAASNGKQLIAFAFAWPPLPAFGCVRISQRGRFH